MRTVFILLLWVWMTGPWIAWADVRARPDDPQQGTIQLTEYRFQPDALTFQSGRPVELTLHNQGSVMHEFITDALRDLEVDVTVNGVVAETLGVAELEVPPQARVVLQFTPRHPGEFPFACRAEKPRDHFREGMSGKLIFQ